jgi:rhodanese-related sulfurtransferase
MKKLHLILVLFIGLTSCNSQVNKKINTINFETLNQNVIGKDVQFIDVRTEKEYDAGHIDDAININVSDESDFIKRIQELDKNKPVYIYCHSGGRSNKASKIMEELGFTGIYDYSDGWSTWNKH